MEKAGYTIKYFHLTKVYKWFGNSVIVNWEKNNNNSCINYDRIIWK